MSMKMHPTRNKFAGRSVLRSRMMAEVYASPTGKRVLRECQEALDRPVNSDEDSRMMVIERFADEVNLFPHEFADLLKRFVVGEPA